MGAAGQVLVDHRGAADADEGPAGGQIGAGAHGPW